MQRRDAFLPLALLLVLGFAAWCFFVLGSGFFIAGLRCDEGCVDQGRGLPGDWSYDDLSWQWDAVMALAFAQFGLAAIALFGALYDMTRTAVSAFVLHAGAVVIAGAIYFSAEAHQLGWRLLLAFIGGEFAALAAGVILITLKQDIRRRLGTPPSEAS